MQCAAQKNGGIVRAFPGGWISLRFPVCAVPSGIFPPSRISV